MRRRLQTIFHFLRPARIGIILLTGFIAATGGMRYVHRHYLDERQASDRLTATDPATDDGTAFRNFRASVRDAEAARGNRPYPSRNAGARAEAAPRLNPAPFNPNTADSLTLCRLGLPGWMARNIVRYREKGGRFRQVEDFRKIYGLTEAQYATLAPYIVLADEDSREDGEHTPPSLLVPLPATDSLPAPALPKYAEGTVVDLNRADTAELKRIPGIGSVIARMIVDYRQRLGGFYALEQLREIRIDHHRLESWLHIDPQAVRRINLNRAGIAQLRNHPYFNFYQAKAIVEYRRREGRLSSLKPFALLEEFSEEDLERISHYVCFE